MGLPGAGKTTLANKVVQLLYAKRLNADKVIFIYLPTFNEIQQNKILINKTQSDIMNYFLNDLKADIHFPQDFSIYDNVNNFCFQS
jgi:thymidylate kinase